MKNKKVNITVKEMFAGVTYKDLIDQNEDWGEVGQEVVEYKLEELLVGMTEEKMMSQYEEYGDTDGERVPYEEKEG